MNQLAIFVVFAVLTICTAMNLRSKAHNKPPGLVKTAAVIERNALDCPSDWAMTVAELFEVPVARCLTGQNAGHCIPDFFLCNNVNDCGDASDEDLSICPPKYCDAFQTNYGMFKCLSTNMCVITPNKCDNDDDCGDGSDEQNCQARSFGASKVKATTGRTSNVNLRSKAHNKPLGLVKTAAVIEQNSPNCPSDWAGHALTDLTGVHPARCLTGQKAGECIPGVFVCDNVNDCGDASDEDLSICPPKDCDAFQTIAGMFKCISTNVCVNTAYKCDYDDDCGDGSDEQNCQARSFASKVKATTRRTSKMNLRSKAHNKSPGLVKTAAVIEQNSPDCPNGGAKCLSGGSAGKCIPSSYLCDNWNDCGDASDEDLSICPELMCELGEFDCTPFNLCIPSNWICDGDNDCGNLSDEASCSSSKVKTTTRHTSRKLHGKK